MKKLFLITTVLCISGFVFGCNNEQTVQEQGSAQSIEFVLPDEEPRTNEMVDALVKLRKTDAENANESDLQVAIDFIKDNYPNYYDDITVTEKVIYYGSLLEYYYVDDDFDLYALGRDAVKATKYVYRGHETIETEATRINLENIEERLDSLQ